jgi:hypothetical protein
MAAPLHPNLARLAATYDDIFARWSRGQIDAELARREISALVARDDDGILWSIDPENGEWLRRTITGELVAGTPPAYGLATPTPHDISQNRGAFNPDLNIHMHKVEDELLYAPSALAGSTRRARLEHTPNERSWKALKIALAVVALIACAWYLSRSNADSPPQAPARTELR